MGMHARTRTCTERYSVVTLYIRVLFVQIADGNILFKAEVKY